jgi:hypothetical protein
VAKLSRYGNTAISNYGNTVYKHRGCIRMDFGDANLFFVLAMDITIFIEGPIVVYFIYVVFRYTVRSFIKLKLHTNNANVAVTKSYNCD